MNATQQLVEKIINYGSATLIVVAFAVAIIYLSVYFISGGVAKSTTIASAVVSVPTTAKGVGQGFKNVSSGLGNYIKDSAVKGGNFGKAPTDK